MSDLSPGYWLFLLDWLIRLAALAWIPTRSAPAAARSWLLLVGFVPLLGLPLYLVLGHPWLAKQRRIRQARASQLIRHRQAGLKQLRWAPQSVEDEVADVARLAERVGDFMPMSGNAVELLDRYDESIARLLADIDAATHEVHLLYYLMYDDGIGRSVANALQRAAGRGVRCRVLLDAVGAKPGLRAWARPLRASGVDVRAMLAGGLAWRSLSRMDLRNHRKLAVIDGHTGHIGSQNLADASFVPGHPNRELVVRARGPAVRQLAALFASDWLIETGEQLEVGGGDGDGAAGTVAAQVLPSGPAYPFQNARDVVIALIQRARERVVLATPYFVPDDATLSALRIAALAGVDVLLVLSASNNKPLTRWAQEAYYEELLRCGVHIALYRPHFLHAKHLSVDDGIALIGSINLDIRSFALNAEAGLLCYDAGVVARLRGIEAGYLDDAERLDLARWSGRPRWRRSREGIARLADSLM
ncbi:cardiolipin synthase [Lysobacter niastensis]|uniref:Cardiolipin synthase n=1 Tax=Lysobacter niastensis TaxID=380629 RepID=A0ABS0BDI6_9GAMM|nr:cardiolipin synthase [Lysobacter niastensis]MBF6026017.1 cardiolipin synthase [Lysobacter niastensis]